MLRYHLGRQLSLHLPVPRVPMLLNRGAGTESITAVDLVIGLSFLAGLLVALAQATVP
jgi:hypothetical protein